MYKKTLKKRALTMLLAGAMSLMPMASAYADVYYMGGDPDAVGPGVGLVEGTRAADDTVSLDAADYASTGGLGLGGMSISSSLPSGYAAVSDVIEVPDAVVKTPEVYTYDYMFHDMDTLSQKYRGRMSYRSAGTSRDGRQIYEIILGNRNAQTHVLFTAAIHAREYITSNLVMKQVEYLLYADANKYAFDGKPVSDWLNEVCIHVVPMANPDGVSISQSGIDGLRNDSLKTALRNCYNYDLANQRTSYSFEEYCRRFKANAIGVDLNQNFDGAWSTASGTATQGSFSGYKGPAAVSEPESRALVGIYSARKYKAVVNYHAQGQVIYWDIAHNKLREHSRDLAHNLAALTGYRMLFSAGGGGFKDYVQLGNNPSTSVTLEIGKTACPVPYTEMTEIWAQNKYVPFYTMKWAKEKGK
ncbi:MAG: M14 family zinc carboxypeptidase [Eubacteriales bacterium]|nr:M14 family zinc carboxypeptidase [Eubacteriales bacterium]